MAMARTQMLAVVSLKAIDEKYGRALLLGDEDPRVGIETLADSAPAG